MLTAFRRPRCKTHHSEVVHWHTAASKSALRDRHTTHPCIYIQFRFTFDISEHTDRHTDTQTRSTKHEEMWFSFCSQTPQNLLFCGISVNLQRFCKKMQLKLRQTSTHKTARGKCTHVHSLLQPIIWAMCNCRPNPARATYR